MKPIVVVPTKDKKRACGIYCPVCRGGTNETTFYSFAQVVAMHRKGTGHSMVYVRLAEVGE